MSVIFAPSIVPGSRSPLRALQYLGAISDMIIETLLVNSSTSELRGALRKETAKTRG